MFMAVTTLLIWPGSGWMMGLLYRERVLTGYWQRVDGPDSELAMIGLKAQAVRSVIGRVIVTHEFSRFNDCAIENRNTAAASL